MKRRRSSTSLTVSIAGSEVALPEPLMAQAKKFALASRAEGTLQGYARAWKRFQLWCTLNQRESLPASVETICGYVTWLASGQDTGKPLSRSRIEYCVAAILFRHRGKGHVLNLKESAPYQSVMGGIRRVLALQKEVRRVRPLTPRQLRDLIDMLRPEVPREARDAAILALAFAAALRRSEVIGLDWREVGKIEDKLRLGYLKEESDGLTVHLLKSKASQDAAEEVAIPRDYAPILVQAIEAWVDVGQIKPGTPLFRSVGARGGMTEVAKSGYRGVTWDRASRKWRVTAWLNGKTKYIGAYQDPYQGHLAWAKAMGRKPEGKGAGIVTVRRLAGKDIAVVVKKRIREWLMREYREGRFDLKVGRLPKPQLKAAIAAAIEARVEGYSGHSLRAGSVTAMIEAGRSNHEVKLISRHKSDQMLSVYFRPVDKRKNWGLKGVAF